MHVSIRHLVRILLVTATLLVVVFSIIPDPIPDTNIEFSDKIKHFFAYGTLGVLAVLSFIRERNRSAVIAVSIICCFTLGGTLEFVQMFVGRNADIIDQILNTAGSISGSFCALPIAKRLFGP
jgi:VanZ family protein